MIYHHNTSIKFCGIDIKFWWSYTVVEIRFIPFGTKDNRANPSKCFGCNYKLATSSQNMNLFIITTQNKLFGHIVIKFWRFSTVIKTIFIPRGMEDHQVNTSSLFGGYFLFGVILHRKSYMYSCYTHCLISTQNYLLCLS